MRYSVVGTDGYTAGASVGVDSACSTSFGIPDGAAGVVDLAEAEIVGAGISQTVAYTF